MERVRIDEVAREDGTQPVDVVARLGGAISTDRLALNYYELDPGDQFGFGLHRHLDQEEIFLVQSGTVTFETPNEEVVVEAGEVVRFESGEFQLGRNAGDRRVEAFAIGAPAESREIEFLRECASCEERTVQRPVPDDEGLVLTCTDCDAETGRVGF